MLRRGIDDFDCVAAAHAQDVDDLVRVAAVERNDVARFVAPFDEKLIQA